ncbi:hypothetical protein D3C86_851640 [compost metagenome]
MQGDVLRRIIEHRPMLDQCCENRLPFRPIETFGEAVDGFVGNIRKIVRGVE